MYCVAVSAVRIGNVDSIHPEVKGMSLENRFKKVREEGEQNPFQPTSFSVKLCTCVFEIMRL